VSQLSFSRIFGDLLRQTFLFFNYFLPYFLHNRKQNRGYDTATLMGEDRGEGEKELTAPLTLTLSRKRRGKQRKMI
jgi:predicted amidophosphoribosyltransferase